MSSSQSWWLATCLARIDLQDKSPMRRPRGSSSRGAVRFESELGLEVVVVPPSGVPQILRRGRQGAAVTVPTDTPWLVAAYPDALSDADLRSLAPALSTPAPAGLGLAAQPRIGDLGLLHLRGLGSLTAIDLRDTPVGNAGVGGLAQMERLRCLNLSGSEVGDGVLESLARRHEELRVLDLSETKLSAVGLEALGECGGLVSLSLRGLRLLDVGLQVLSRLSALSQLELTDCRRVTNAGIIALAAQRGMKALDLSGTGVTNACLDIVCELRKLDFLGLARTKIGGRALERLTPLKELTSLDLSGSAIDDDGLGPLFRLSSLRTLDLSGTVLTGRGLKFLAGHGQLSSLALADCPELEPRHLVELRSLPNLRSLNLERTAVSDEILAELSQMAGLQRLSLRGCKGVSDEGLAQLAALPELAMLDVSGTSIRRSGLRALKTFPKLQRVDVSGLDDRGGIEDGLGELEVVVAPLDEQGEPLGPSRTRLPTGTMPINLLSGSRIKT